MCTNGGNDTVGPVVNGLKPLDGSTQSGDVTFEYTANDVGSGVAHCSLVVSDVIYQTEFNVDEMNANEFIQAFIEKNRSYTAKIVCTDNANNIGVSNEATFFYEDAIMCQDSSDCGDYSEELFCRNDDLYKEITNPRCVGNTCTVDITEELVRTCKNGCSDGRCNNGGGGGGNENDDDTDRIPIIVHATSIFDDTNVTQGDTGIIIATATPVLGAETKTTINWWVVILLLLIIGIILLLILIILAGFD